MHGADIQLKEIESALLAEELTFHYQPKVSFLTGEIIGCEALLRWLNPDGTVILPDDFLPQAESSGFITEITAVMLPKLIEDIEALRAVKSDIQVAFNISALDLRSPYLVKMLRSFIGGRRIDPGNIQIEITETAVVDASERVRTGLLDLVALGIELVMDDYGTGYSSLEMLSRMPFSALKLDQGVVRRMTEDAKNTHIVRSSLYLARELSIKTVAEGVETAAIYAFLLASGCNEAQGFWIGEAASRDDFVALCKQRRRWPASSYGLLYNAWVNYISYRQKVLDLVHTLMLTKPGEWGQLPKMELSHSPARCRLGQWYRDASHGGGSPDYMRLEGPHRLMHAAGESLVRAAQSNPEPDVVIKAIKAFLEYSDVVDAEVSNIVERWMEKSLRQSLRPDDE
ncbi:MAG TPA: EAL domain-containing protein [Rhodospirillales bacterium]|nr:EAL domain-containing protein [Rhodospirillales bacterium]